VEAGQGAVFTREEVGYILAAATEHAPAFVTLFTFLFETGCRKSEAINLPWKNVRFEQRIIRIWSDPVADDSDDAYLVKSMEREIPLSDHMLRLLRAQKLKGLSKDLVFPVLVNRNQTKGKPYVEFPTNTWDRVLEHATALARKVDPEAPEIVGGPHKARHTFASHFLQRKPDIFLLGRVLGHSHTRVTELYSHLLPEHLAEARNVVMFAGAGERAAEAVAEIKREKAEAASGRTAS
jgi:integrase